MTLLSAYPAARRLQSHAALASYTRCPRNDIGFIAQDIDRLPPEIDPGVLIILPLAYFRNEVAGHPQATVINAVLGKYQLTLNGFAECLIEGYNELIDVDRAVTYMESIIAQSGVGLTDYDVTMKNVEVLEDLAQMFTALMDRHLIHQGVDLTSCSHDLHLVRSIGTDALVVRILPCTSD